MGVDGRDNRLRPGGETWLDLLHREAEGDLNPAEQRALAALPNQPEIDQQRRRLAHAAATLRGLPPPALPHTLATRLAADVAVSVRLSAAPPPPRSVAAEVAGQVALAAALQAQAPRLPHSVAAAVAAEVRADALLGQLASPGSPASIAAAAGSEVSWSARLHAPVPPMPRSVAADVVARLGEPQTSASRPTPAPLPALSAPTSEPGAALALSTPRRNPAPLTLVVALMVGLTLLAVTTAWPNLAAGALVLRTLLAQVSPLAGVGLALLLITSALVTWRPGPAAQWAGAGAFALSALLTLPAVADVAARGDIRFGQDVTVTGAVSGNVIAVGGHVYLNSGARVRGEVVTLLGDVYRDPGAQVGGHVSALLGQAPGDPAALQTAPPEGIGMATAAAFRPVLGWLGSAAWPQVFVTLTGGALLLLFVAGLAPLLARRQRHAPIRTLALGVLILAALLLPALGLALAGLLGPALVACALAGVLIALGLSVSAYDAGRTLALRLRLPVPDAVGALLGLSAVAASLSEPPLALSLALVGGAWGAGTLLLTRGPRAA
ncbi:polymer-forming cytoskeletal protein [Deinococcus koreensis]|uniref:polymer-forming cytoskeletal protein n=1 Tax=Deinococcus koreensis TaxID=2054903 RepID=UPI0013FD9C89|nr:polymer-forming cytoskeletal protein [Deinococcus koreensis]